MKKILGIFLALAVALPLMLMPAAVSANPGTTVFTAGVNDNFVLPTEPTSPSSNLQGRLSSWPLKDFDDPMIDRFVAHTFAGLPPGIVSATLEIHLRAGASSMSVNDIINLTFVEDALITPPIGFERWSRFIGTSPGAPGVLPYNWVSPAVDTIILDLSNLPLAVGQPSSASNLIPALNQHGFLDFWIQDDTDVDYMILTVCVVDIDIKPGSDPNSINLKSKGVVPVAVLTTADFDASTVDPATVEFAGASPVRWTMEDVDSDGDMDMLFHFKTQELDLTASSTEATLTGDTSDPVNPHIEGTDTVNIVPKGKK